METVKDEGVDKNATVKLKPAGIKKDGGGDRDPREFPQKQALELLTIKNSRWSLADEAWLFDGRELSKAVTNEAAELKPAEEKKK